MTESQEPDFTNTNPMDEPPMPGSSYEAVWTFRGYKMRPPEFNTAMVHYYRAEIQRSNVWRSRLDTTTNWAVVSVAAAITFVFAAPENHWGVFLLIMLLTMLFLFIEARRYRYYELWSLRARLMETDFFAAMLVPPFAPHAEWNETLAESLLQPQFPISRLEAMGRRLRNNYLALFSILWAAILMKLYHPSDRGPISGRTHRPRRHRPAARWSGAGAGRGFPVRAPADGSRHPRVARGQRRSHAEIRP